MIALGFLIMAKSRTSFAAGLLSLWVLWTMLSTASRKLIAIFGGVLAMCLLVLLLGDTLFPVLKETVFLGRFDETSYTLTGRIPLWRECLEYVWKRPIRGYGYGSFWSLGNVDVISESQGWQISGGHSVFVELLLNVGVIGLAVFFGIFAVGWNRTKRYFLVSNKVEYAFIRAFLAFCFLDGFLESTLLDPLILTFFLAVVLIFLGFRDPQKDWESSRVEVSESGP